MCKYSFLQVSNWFVNWFVKIHTSNYMYSGTQKMIELVSFSIVHHRLCMIEKIKKSILKCSRCQYIHLRYQQFQFQCGVVVLVVVAIVVEVKAAEICRWSEIETVNMPTQLCWFRDITALLGMVTVSIESWRAIRRDRRRGEIQPIKYVPLVEDYDRLLVCIHCLNFV